MPPPLLIDLDQIDLGQVCVTKEQIYERLPQRHEFSLLDGVCMVDRDGLRLVAFADIRAEDWWVRGHIPNRPLLPGILMLEMAAQASAVLASFVGNKDAFIGFGGIDQCKFRETVVPPTRLHLLCAGRDYRPRRIISNTQGVVGDKLIFEAQITGLIIRKW